MDISDSVLDHLRHVAALPDLALTRYELESEIGRGGMGVVYAARDRDLDRRVALKVLDVALSGEAQLIARLEHPAVVPIYETGTLPDGRAFYAMKLVSGARLDRYIAGLPSLAKRLAVIRRVGEALAFAHARGSIHRDLKPQNVMVGAFGEVYVMDWGVDGVAGTPGFRAPDARLDQRSDIYGLGALAGIMVGSSIKGMIVGLFSGWFARKVQSMRWGIVVGAGLGLLFAFLVAATDTVNGRHPYLEIMLPGFTVGAIIGFLTQKMGTSGRVKEGER